MKFRKVMAWVLLMMMAVSFAHGEEEAAPVPPFGDFSEKYSDLFLAPGQEAVQGELYYYSENIFLEITPLRELRSDIYIADIYAAREKDTGEISSRDLCDAIPHAHYTPALSDAVIELKAALSEGDIFVTVGAGDVFLAGEDLLNQ